MHNYSISAHYYVVSSIHSAIGAQTDGAFGSGAGPIYYDNVQCTGMEQNLTQCAHNGLEIHNCDYTEAADVRCQGWLGHHPFSNLIICFHRDVPGGQCAIGSGGVCW